MFLEQYETRFSLNFVHYLLMLASTESCKAMVLNTCVLCASDDTGDMLSACETAIEKARYEGKRIASYLKTTNNFGLMNSPNYFYFYFHIYGFNQLFSVHCFIQIS